MKIEGDEVIFSTGTRVQANDGVIGISSPDEYGWDVREGYDGHLGSDNLTKEEKVELAEYMICLWQEFKSDCS